MPIKRGMSGTWPIERGCVFWLRYRRHVKRGCGAVSGAQACQKGGVGLYRARSAPTLVIQLYPRRITRDRVHKGLAQRSS